MGCVTGQQERAEGGRAMAVPWRGDKETRGVEDIMSSIRQWELTYFPHNLEDKASSTVEAPCSLCCH